MGNTHQRNFDTDQGVIAYRDPLHAVSLIMVIWAFFVMIKILRNILWFSIVFIGLIVDEARGILRRGQVQQLKEDPFLRALSPYSSLYRLAWVVIGSLLLLFPLAAFQLSVQALAVRDDIMQDMQSGYQALNEANLSLIRLDGDRAQSKALHARSMFDHAFASLHAYDGPLFMVMSHVPFLGSRLRTADASIDVGKHISSGALTVATIEHNLSHLEQGETIGTVLNNASPAFDLLEQDIKAALISSEKIEERALPAEFRNQFKQRQSQLRSLYGIVAYTRVTLEHISDALGTSTLRRYLILFQNNAELRASGGFIGSFALIDVVDGALSHIEIPPGGPYDLRGSLHKSVVPPEPLQTIAKQWEFQDANWYADFPKTAQHVLWFYEASGGPTVDGVIAINASLIPHLIALSGPIPLDSYGLTLTDTTVLDELQKEVELRYDRSENKPKKIIADLFPLLMDKLLSRGKEIAPQLTELFFQALNQKELQFYFTDEKKQSALHESGYDGSLIQPNPDYLMIVDTNIGGAKTDAVISSQIQRVSTVNTDGTIDATLSILRDHRGIPNTLFTGVANNNYVRIYVPKGSRLSNATGFTKLSSEAYKQTTSHARIYDELVQPKKIFYDDKMIESWDEEFHTVFAGWIITKPSQQEQTTLSYRLPFRIQDLPSEKDTLRWSTILQRQSGSTLSSVILSYDVPNTFKTSIKSRGAVSPISESPHQSVQYAPFQGDSELTILLQPQ